MKLSEVPGGDTPASTAAPPTQGITAPPRKKLSEVSAASTAAPPAEPPGPPMDRMDRFGTGAVDPFIGAAQAGAHLGLGAAGEAQSYEAAETTNAIARLFGWTPGPEPKPPDYKENVKNVDKTVAEREKTIEKESPPGFDPYRFGGNVLSPANALIPGGMAGKGVSTGARVAGGIVSGMAGAATQPVTEGSFWSQKTKQVGLGAVLGLGTERAGAALGAIAGPRLEKSVQTLVDAGVTLTPGQLLQGVTKHIEDLSKSVPLVRQAIEHGQKASMDSFNRAVIDKSLSEIGTKLPKDVEMGRPAIAFAERAISEKYDAILPKVTFEIDPELKSGIGALAQSIKRAVPEAQQKQWQEIVKDALLRLDPQGRADGFTFKQMDSEMGFLARKYAKAPDPAQSLFGEAINELRGMMRDALERGNPTQAEELQKANSAWAAFTRAQGASIQRAKSGGIFTPNDLLADIKRQSSRGTFARGDGLLQDLADAASHVMASTIPDSATATRHAWVDTLLAGAGAAAGAGPAIANPGTAAAAAVGGGLAASAYSKPGMKAIQGVVTSAPGAAVREPMEQIAPHLANAAGVAAGREEQ